MTEPAADTLADEAGEGSRSWWRSTTVQWLGINALVVAQVVYCLVKFPNGGWYQIAAVGGVLAAMAAWWAQFGRWSGGPPQAAEHGTLLPRRPGNMASGLVACLVQPVPSVAFGVLALDSGSRSPFAWGMIATSPVFVVLAVGIAVGWARGRARLRLTPAGMEYLPVWARRPVVITWASVVSVRPDGSLGNGVLVLKGATPVPMWTGNVGVRPQTLITLLSWYADQPGDREETTDPDAVEARIRALEGRAGAAA